ncbi:MAG TPA: HD domain-containing phosphohydrolase [Terriglobales bacterium]|nr:HD domain-containing phosphohydrolase [Terriglobales bacterium]
MPSKGSLAAANAFVAGMSAAALGCLALGWTHWHSDHPVKFFCYLALAITASFLKIKLPGVNATMSVNFIFVLLGVLELSLGETLVLGLAEVLVQSKWRSSKTVKPVHVLFNAAQFSVGTAVAYGTYTLATRSVLRGFEVVALIVVAVTYFAFNTLAVATVVRLAEGKPILKIWSECYFWYFPYYLAGAAITGLINFLNRHLGWQSSLLVFPPVYLIYRSYRLYLDKLENEKRHAEDVSRINLRTIEALALAIEAKDHTTHDHLQRVRVYAMELGKDLGLSEAETEALKAASVLHDIGKLAVPEHIISKPGKLTAEEFEKMKIHPIVGAEILEQVEFPYPVVPVVRSHHEKWDGSGYPDGLKGETIPIGARILAAVDCLDALATDRQYRRALPLDEAMARVEEESGKSFDPKVVSILRRRYIELERMAKEQPLGTPPKLSTDIKVERGLAPAAGFAESGKAVGQKQHSNEDIERAISAAREEGQVLTDIAQSLGSILRLSDIFSLIAVRLKQLVPHDAVAIYVNRKDVLVPEYVNGDNSRLFSSLRIPIGEGLSGWVAQNRKPILNGNPSVEPGYMNDPTKYSTLRSALAVPLETDSAVVAVLALYRQQQDGFSKEHLQIVATLVSRLGIVIENASSSGEHGAPAMASASSKPLARAQANAGA